MKRNQTSQDLTSLINPEHYKQVKIKGVVIEPADVIDAFVPDDAHLSQALKYLLRRGRKPGTTYLSDVGKGLWWVARAIMVRGGKIELPPKPGVLIAEEIVKAVTTRRGRSSK